MGAADVDLSGSIDLRPLPISPDFTAYVNENARPVAAGQTGRPWLRMDRGYSGATGGDVRLGGNADPRWGGGPPGHRGARLSQGTLIIGAATRGQQPVWSGFGPRDCQPICRPGSGGRPLGQRARSRLGGPIGLARTRPSVR